MAEVQKWHRWQRWQNKCRSSRSSPSPVYGRGVGVRADRSSRFQTTSDFSEARNSSPQTEHPELPATLPGNTLAKEIEPDSQANPGQTDSGNPSQHPLIHNTLWIAQSRRSRPPTAGQACGLLHNAPREKSSIRGWRSRRTRILGCGYVHWRHCCCVIAALPHPALAYMWISQHEAPARTFPPRDGAGNPPPESQMFRIRNGIFPPAYKRPKAQPESSRNL